MWWKQKIAATTSKAVAYYRHSAQDRQENSIPIQRDQVRKFAQEHGIRIIREFADHGKSGLSTEGRDGFNEMLEQVVTNQEEFDYILVLDVSRWGRFQDIDMSAHYRGLCKQYGKQVIYTTIGFPKEDDPLHFMQLNFEGYRAATYSRELSDKVFNGCAKIAEQGFRAGGLPPYGLHRILLDEQRQPVQILHPGQRKSIQNQRVTLAPGDKNEVRVIRRIFNEYVEQRRCDNEIAESLNNHGIPSPGGKQWTSGNIKTILQNEIYLGTMIYNKTGQRLQSGTKRNPEEKWIKKEHAFQGIVDRKIFQQAQVIMKSRAIKRQKKYSNEDMLIRLKKLYRQQGIITARQISTRKDMLSPATYTKHFFSLDMAFQEMYSPILKRTKILVTNQLNNLALQVEEFDDYLVLNDTFSIVVQPSVPIPFGYQEYWSFRPDPRIEVDMTLGVPLSNNGQYNILGYLAFPRMLVHSTPIKLFCSNETKLGLYGYPNLDILESIVN